MTVSTAYSVLTFNGNGATTAFAVSWPFFDDTDLVVTAIDADGVETVKTITTHYTVSGGADSDGLPSTGTVTMLTAPASGTQLRITRSTPKTQATAFNTNAKFPAKSIEAALDKAVLISQEGGSAGTVYDEITGDVMTLNSAGATDYWDAESHPIQNVTDPTNEQDAATKAYVDGLAYGTSVSAFAQTLLDDANAAAARTTLGVDAAGTDNSTNVTLAGTPDYITISGQVITRNAVDLTADVTGTLPHENGGLEANISAYEGIPQIKAGVTSAAPIKVYQGTIADDAAASFSIQSVKTGIVIFVIGQAGLSAICSWDSIGTYALEALIEGSLSAGIDQTTGALTGTTGADGRITISIHTDNKIYLENRYAATYNYTVYILGAA